MIFDYLPLPDLLRQSQLSRGLYWLSGNQLLLFKFQSSKKGRLFSLERAPNSLSPVSKQRQLLQQRIKRGR